MRTLALTRRELQGELHCILKKYTERELECPCEKEQYGLPLLQASPKGIPRVARHITG